MDLRSWLRSLDLERYAEAFEDNELEFADLADLSTEDLKEELGVRRLPDRKKLLKAIEQLGGGPPTGEAFVEDEPAPKPARTLAGRPGKDPPEDPYVDAKVAGRFRVDAALPSTGASGQMYRATCTERGEAVALKIIPADVANDSGAVEAYRDAATQAGELDGPAYLRMRAFGDAHGGDKFMVTDYVGGPSLASVLADEGSMDHRRALRIAGEVVAVAHALGVNVEPMGGIPGELYVRARSDADARRQIGDKMRAYGKALGAGRPSLAHDVIKGRSTEVDFLNGLVVRRGQEVGVPTPVNEQVVELTKRVEAGDIAPSPSNFQRIDLSL